MVPIHDTDVAVERWKKAEWTHYELWEKVEQRLKRRKRLWIGLTALLFIMLSAVPIVRERLPQWKGLSAARRLSQEVNQLKRDAAIEKAAFRLKFNNASGSTAYTVERTPSCAQAGGDVVRSVELMKPSDVGTFAVISTEQGHALNLPGLVEQLCYDPVNGNFAASSGENLIGVGIIPARDLAESRLDRIALMLLTGLSAEVAFD
jgi:hypothetical protein